MRNKQYTEYVTKAAEETNSEINARVNKPKRSGRTAIIGGIVLGAIVAGGCIASHDNDPKPRTPYTVTNDILPSDLRAPQLPSSEATKPATTKKPEVTYPQLTSLPTDIPALGKLCLTGPMNPAKTAVSENGSLVVRIDTRCFGGDPKKESSAEVPVLQNPNDPRSQDSTLKAVKTGQIANILCVADGPPVTASNGATSEAWAKADIYASDGTYEGRGFIPDAATGSATSDPKNGEFIPACGNNRKPYFP